MKKLLKNKKGISGIILIAILIGIIIFMIYLGFNPIASILFEANELSCSDSISKEMFCSPLGKASASSGIGDKFYFVVTKPSDQQQRVNLLCNKLTFFNIPCPVYSGSTARYRGETNDAIINNLGKQLIIIDGEISDIYGNRKSFRTYGLCDRAGFDGCWAHAPVIGNEILYPSSMIVYFKEGGYSEADFLTPSTPEEKIIYEIIKEETEQKQEQQIPTESQTQIPEEISSTPSVTKPSGIFGWFSNLINKIKGWFKK